jgi:hypothetical protein
LLWRRTFFLFWIWLLFWWKPHAVDPRIPDSEFGGERMGDRVLAGGLLLGV